MPTMRQRGTPAVQTAPIVRDYGTLSANTTLQLSTADVHLITLGASITLTLDTSTVPDRTKVRVYLTQDGTGSRLVTWSGVTWLSGTAPVLTTTTAAIDVLEFIYFSSASGTGTWYGRPIYLKNAVFPGTVTITGTETVARVATARTSMVALNATPTTLFAVSEIGLTIVSAYLLNVGSPFQAWAQVSFDGVSAVLLRTDSGSANFVLSLSGTNVQITQTSGGSLTVSYKTLVVA